MVYHGCPITTRFWNSTEVSRRRENILSSISKWRSHFRAPSTRLVAAIWWFFTLIMVSSYTANLASFLTLEPATKTIDGAESLKNCHLPDYKCPVQFGAKRGGSTLNFFRVCTDSDYVEVCRKFILHMSIFRTQNMKRIVTCTRIWWLIPICYSMTMKKVCRWQ